MIFCIILRRYCAPNTGARIFLSIVSGLNIGVNIVLEEKEFYPLGRARLIGSKASFMTGYIAGQKYLNLTPN